MARYRFIWRGVLLAGGFLPARAVIIDRTAIVVGTHVIKDSDIDLDIRVTSFLNGEQPDFSAANRKKTASRLIDQELIRNEIRAGDYPIAMASEADSLLADLKQRRFGIGAGYQQALKQFGLNEADLKSRLLWQLTVLRFIDIRFRPAVIVSDQEIEQFYEAHQAQLQRSHPGAKGLDQLKSTVAQQLSGERVNSMLDQWLKEARSETRIEYLEKALQ